VRATKLKSRFASPSALPVVRAFCSAPVVFRFRRRSDTVNEADEVIDANGPVAEFSRFTLDRNFLVHLFLGVVVPDANESIFRKLTKKIGVFFHKSWTLPP
jgi:hypothetical protein